MKQITAIALLAMASFAIANKSFAQDHAVRATVPFDFTVGDKLLPSGTYTITSTSNVVEIKNHDKPILALTVALRDHTESGSTGKLVFRQYGNQYFLHQILCDSAGMNLGIPSSKLEKRARLQEARVNQSGQTFVAAR